MGYIIFGLLSIIGSALLVLVVLIQNSKGGGLSSTFGASNLTNMIGTRRATQDIEKVTWYLAFGLFAVSFVANVAGGRTQAVQQQSLSGILDAPGAPPAPPSQPPAQQQLPGGNGTPPAQGPQ